MGSSQAPQSYASPRASQRRSPAREDPSVIYALQASNAALREEVTRLRRGGAQSTQLEEALSRQVDMLAEASRRAAVSRCRGKRLGTVISHVHRGSLPSTLTPSCSRKHNARSTSCESDLRWSG